MPESMKKILVIEDDPLSGEFLKLFLEGENYTVSCVGTCAEINKIFLDHQFDIIIADLNLPDGSPYMLLVEQQKKHCAHIIGLSGYALSDLPEAIDKNIFNGFIQKPVNLTKLLQVIETSSTE